MATDTMTKPVIDGGTTKTKVFKNFIDGETGESKSSHPASVEPSTRRPWPHLPA